MEPYTKPVANADKQKSIFNYRLSRAWGVSENAFGLLAQVFRVFYSPIALKPEIANKLLSRVVCIICIEMHI